MSECGRGGGEGRCKRWGGKGMGERLMECSEEIWSGRELYHSISQPKRVILIHRAKLTPRATNRAKHTTKVNGMS